jgi:ABC-type transport system involved in multi-copper enzyme maturation permease subunit
MRAFLTIIGDSMRLLRARALFWISLGISLLVALLYLSIGFDEKGVSVMFGAFHFEDTFMAKGTKGAEVIYLGLFSNVIIGMWLSWVAIVIALISCAPIFPEFLAEGSAGVALSKPVSRPLLFLYKFAGALLFVAVQTSLFAVIVFLAIRWRIGVWNPTVFWSVPIMILMFSYLYSVLAWFGIKTGSVMASVLLTLLFWVFCFCSSFSEQVGYAAAVHGKNPFTGMELKAEDQADWQSIYLWLKTPHAILPKTGETTGLLNRWIVLGDGTGLGESTIDAMSRSRRVEGLDDAKDDLKRHSTAWIIGTSLAFEAVVLALACRRFSRRDF